MTGDVVIGDQVSFFGDDGAAADALVLDLAALVIFGRDHVDAHQSRFHSGNG